MAGRGCTITIKLLDSSGGVEDISLPVALHSPLLVLKQELAEFVSIRPSDQVLILCDLSDPDRNSDVLLTGRDEFTLLECGLKNGSILTLHALGMSAEARQAISKAALSESKEVVVEDKNAYDLVTPIGPELADHSYNGIIFDVEARGPFEVTLQSVSIAGMLGRVRIYARDKGWEEGPPSANGSGAQHWWAHRESLNTEGWEIVSDTRVRPSWDKPTAIKLATPIVILPHCRRAIYVHSSLPDDLGIQYQSYRKRDVVAESAHLVLHPGLGHTGSIPFDEVGGWYRSYRGLAGAVGYRGIRKGWNWTTHAIFPQELKLSVQTMLLCHVRSREMGGGRRGLASLPLYVMYYVFQFMHWDWFEETKQVLDDEEAEVPVVQTRRPQGMGSQLMQLMHFLGGAGGGWTAGAVGSEGVEGDSEEEDGEWVDMAEDEDEDTDDDVWEDQDEEDDDDEDEVGEDDEDDDDNEGDDQGFSGATFAHGEVVYGSAIISSDVDDGGEDSSENDGEDDGEDDGDVSTCDDDGGDDDEL